MTDRQWYVIAIKRQWRKELNRNWVDQLANISGVELRSSSASRAQFSADEDTIRVVREQFADRFLIEKEITRNTPAW